MQTTANHRACLRLDITFAMVRLIPLLNPAGFRGFADAILSQPFCLRGICNALIWKCLNFGYLYGIRPNERACHCQNGSKAMIFTFCLII
jgi:hypothetical protein